MDPLLSYVMYGGVILVGLCIVHRWLRRSVDAFTTRYDNLMMVISAIIVVWFLVVLLIWSLS